MAGQIVPTPPDQLVLKDQTWVAASLELSGPIWAVTDLARVRIRQRWGVSIAPHCLIGPALALADQLLPAGPNVQTLVETGRRCQDVPTAQAAAATDPHCRGGLIAQTSEAIDQLSRAVLIDLEPVVTDQHCQGDLIVRTWEAIDQPSRAALIDLVPVVTDQHCQGDLIVRTLEAIDQLSRAVLIDRVPAVTDPHCRDVLILEAIDQLYQDALTDLEPVVTGRHCRDGLIVLIDRSLAAIGRIGLITRATSLGTGRRGLVAGVGVGDPVGIIGTMIGALARFAVAIAIGITAVGTATGRIAGTCRLPGAPPAGVLVAGSIPVFTILMSLSNKLRLRYRSTSRSP